MHRLRWILKCEEHKKVIRNIRNVRRCVKKLNRIQLFTQYQVLKGLIMTGSWVSLSEDESTDSDDESSVSDAIEALSEKYVCLQNHKQ